MAELDLTALTPPELFAHLSKVINEAAARDHDRSMELSHQAERVAELEADVEAKNNHIAARTDDRDYYAHRVDELTGALRTVLDSAWHNSGEVAPRKFDAAQRVLDVVQAPGHVPPCSHAERVAELEGAKANDEFIHELYEALHGRRAPVVSPEVWRGLLADVRSLPERIVDMEADLGRLALRAGDLKAERDRLEARRVADGRAHAAEDYNLIRQLDQALKLLRALVDADAPFVAGTAAESSGQTMEAESARAVAWQAARNHLLGALPDERADQADDGAVLVYRDALALLAGTVDDWVPAAHRSEELATVLADTTAALQAAAGRSVETVQTGGERL